jgi:hypothetical protein
MVEDDDVATLGPIPISEIGAVTEYLKRNPNSNEAFFYFTYK